MRRVMIISIALAVLATGCYSCVADGYSEGDKFGTVQKVSHKNFGDYYVVEVAYIGGRAVSTGESSTYSNSQEFKTSSEVAEKAKLFLGREVKIKYHNEFFELLGPSSKIDAIETK